MYLTFTATFLRAYGRLLRMSLPAWGAGVTMIVALGLLWGWVEKVPVGDSLYFSLVTAMTIGFGDLVPATALGRVLSLAIGFVGLLTTGILVAISLHAVRVSFDSLLESPADRQHHKGRV